MSKPLTYVLTQGRRALHFKEIFNLEQAHVDRQVLASLVEATRAERG